MGTYDLNAPVTSRWSSAPTGGTVSLAVTKPDGTALSPAPTVTRQGNEAVATYVPTMAGRYFLAWSCTSGASGAYTDIVDVWPADPRFLISVDDARNALGWPVGTVTSGWVDDLRLYIAAATPVIEDIVGTIPKTNFTQQIQKGWSFAALYERPVNSIISITYPDLSTITSYRLNAGSGMLELDTPVTDTVTVTYSAGLTVVPQNVRLATRELVRHWWQQSMQASRGQASAEEVALTNMGYAVPRRVMEMCGPNKKISGFA